MGIQQREQLLDDIQLTLDGRYRAEASCRSEQLVDHHSLSKSFISAFNSVLRSSRVLMSTHSCAACAPSPTAPRPSRTCAPAAAAGAQVLDGLGAVGDGAHAAHEWVDISTLEDRSKLLHALIKDLLND